MQRLALRCKVPKKNFSINVPVAIPVAALQRRFYVPGQCDRNPLNPEPGYSENSSASTLPVPVFRKDVVYANPICSQMDQLLLQAGDYATVLDLLVTHRGVFFIHNLVTAIQMLAHIATNSDVYKQAAHLKLSYGGHTGLNRNNHPERLREDLLRDHRFDVLLRDLTRFGPRMDHLAVRDVLQALKVLDHKYYLIFRRVYRPLMDLPLPDVQTILDISDCFRWAGYATHPFFNRCSSELSRIESLPKEDLVKLADVYGSLDKYRPALFANIEKLILQHTAEDFTGKELATFATCFSKHFSTNHDKVFLLQRVGSAATCQERAVLSLFSFPIPHFQRNQF